MRTPHVGLGPAAPGELISLTGMGLGPESGISYKPAPDGSAPRELAGVRVLFNDLPAPLLYVQSQQINTIVPFELAGRATTKLRIEYNGARTNTVDAHVGVVIGPVDPEICPNSAIRHGQVLSEMLGVVECLKSTPTLWRLPERFLSIGQPQLKKD